MYGTAAKGAIVNKFVTAISSTTTNSTTASLLNGMSLELPAGRHAIFFTTSVQTSLSGTVTFSLYLDGVEQAETKRSSTISAITDANIVFHTSLTINKLSVIEVRWKVSNGLNIATCKERVLSVFKVG